MRGDREAFTRLVDLHWCALHRWLWGLCGKDQTAEDLAQESFLRAWKTLASLADPGAFRVWLFRIARNLWLDDRKKASRHPLLGLSGTLPGKEATPLIGILETEGRSKIQSAIARLPIAYREVYLLWSQEAMSAEAIASVMDIAEGTVRWRLCKARQMLLKQLQTYLDRTHT